MKRRDLLKGSTALAVTGFAAPLIIPNDQP